MAIKLAIVGYRGFNNFRRFVFIIDYLHSIYGILNDVCQIVSGGAEGVDLMAEKFADERGYDKKIFYPKYDVYSQKVAPLMRNTEIAETCDIMIAFKSEYSRGTLDAIKKATKLGKPVYIVCI